MPGSSSTPPHPTPQLTLVQAVGRNLPLALLPVIVLVGAAVAVGLTRTPKYSSDAQLNVGGVNLTIESIPGYTVGVAQLAVTYSRTVDAVPVVQRAARLSGLTPREVRVQTSATPVEGAPVLRVHAEAKEARLAERLANATGESLVAYAQVLTSSNPDTPRLLKRYARDSRDLRLATKALGNAKSDRARQRAQQQVDLATLRRNADAALYGQSRAGGSATSLVQQIAPASAASSDRFSVLQQYVIAAIIAGGLIGVGLAVARASAANRRRLTPV